MCGHTSGRVTSFVTMREMECAGVRSYILTSYRLRCERCSAYHPRVRHIHVNNVLYHQSVILIDKHNNTGLDHWIFAYHYFMITSCLGYLHRPSSTRHWSAKRVNKEFYEFELRDSVHRGLMNKIPTRCSKSSSFFFVLCSTCFGRYIHPSSGASTV
jgi:hypothetical protein